MEFIAEHKAENFTIGAVAESAATTVRHFRKEFQAAIGQSLAEHVSKVRVGKAQTQLQNPRRGMSNIARDVEFSSATQFNRTIKRVFCESPGEFRTKRNTVRSIQLRIL